MDDGHLGCEELLTPFELANLAALLPSRVCIFVARRVDLLRSLFDWSLGQDQVQLTGLRRRRVSWGSEQEGLLNCHDKNSYSNCGLHVLAKDVFGANLGQRAVGLRTETVRVFLQVFF